MRGHPSERGTCPCGTGSIPADAGAPGVVPPRWASAEVYPRGCGGTMGPSPSNSLVEGLSPRMRGHLEEMSVEHLQERSIPADAGAPTSDGEKITTIEVYPRGCGGTCSSLSGTGRYGPVAPCIASNTRQSVARSISISQRVGSIGQMQQRRRLRPIRVRLGEDHREPAGS